MLVRDTSPGFKRNENAVRARIAVDKYRDQVRHPADQLSINKASIFRLGLIHLVLKLGENGWTVRRARGGTAHATQRQSEYEYGSRRGSHLAPQDTELKRVQILCIDVRWRPH
jgi:hypothetical protein